MKSLLLDTHAWVWSLTADERLSAKATALIEQAASVFVSPITLFEVGQKVRIGKWPEMELFANKLAKLLEEQGGRIAALTPEICLRAAMLEWGHRDPFDRLIAATAMENNMPLISVDEVFDSLSDRPDWIARLW
ncbi:type II toxin-antitoxin system VapC family toxin [Rhizobium calliandrae]|uniref:Type II toxin-antitoxin system VapC family toxin n=1 Tax=Rhizobium calliandrae TaxID=1312182 RepID=A0ABT7KIE5_9HYPH|nr:type II toxin-antitoxin system VapC family toxin [Rhizobium calliandrae]MDL2408399.1 type II toxin-antitoxin system VapC family toxin [Rhizobium calliandrae]